MKKVVFRCINMQSSGIDTVFLVAYQRFKCKIRSYFSFFCEFFGFFCFHFFNFGSFSGVFLTNLYGNLPLIIRAFNASFKLRCFCSIKLYSYYLDFACFCLYLDLIC